MFLRTLILACLVLTAAQGLRAGEAALAMPDHWSAEAAQRVLVEGGNAVDAAVAAAFVLAVTYPEAGNIGGGGFMTSYIGGEAAFLDFRERAPAAAQRDMFLDEGGQFLPRRSTVGALAVGVPGTVRGMAAAHERYGSLAWKRLLAPAIALARDGFEVPSALAQMAQESSGHFAGETNFDAYFGELRAGQVFRQPELADTLKLIASDPEAFYGGELARKLVEQMRRSGGLITLKDLADYRALWREPLRIGWRELEVLTAPPPSSGGIALIQLLTMRDAAADQFEGLWHNSASYVHLLAELEKRVFADRAEYLGDPEFSAVPVDELLAPAYLVRRASEIRPGEISPISATRPGLESPQTTHFSILDARGNAVSLTYTLNWEFGSGVVVAGAGYLLNNEMDDFSAKPGVPNAFGVVGNDRNAVEPGKRMLSSMTPTIVLQDGKPALIIGTPGGSTIFTSVFQVILNLYSFDMPLQQAVNAQRFHHQLPEAKLLRYDQAALSDTVRASLEGMGYEVVANPWGELGDVQAIAVAAGGVTAASDRRGRGASRVFSIGRDTRQ